MKTKSLNLIDILALKKDLLWGKYYYGLFDQGDLKDSILYKYAFDNNELIEILKIERQDKVFIEKFTHEMSLRDDIKYFIRELDENLNVEDIQFMNDCGFKRFNRNYCFEFDGSSIGSGLNKHFEVYCRELDSRDIKLLLEIDNSNQVLEYRDGLNKTKTYFKNNFENVYVFTYSNDLSKILGFAYKKESDHNFTFQFVISNKTIELISECIIAFAERYIQFEKANSAFRFVIDDNLHEFVENLRVKYNLISSSQMLILEGYPKEKNKSKLAHNQALFNSMPVR